MADKIYERFDELRETKGVSVYAVSKATGITTTTFTNWKNGKYTPKQDKLQLSSDFFGGSLDYLKTGKEFDEFSEDSELSKALLKYFELSEEKRKHIVETINMLSEV